MSDTDGPLPTYPPVTRWPGLTLGGVGRPEPGVLFGARSLKGFRQRARALSPRPARSTLTLAPCATVTKAAIAHVLRVRSDPSDARYRAIAARICPARLPRIRNLARCCRALRVCRICR